MTIWGHQVRAVSLWSYPLAVAPAEKWRKFFRVPSAGGRGSRPRNVEELPQAAVVRARHSEHSPVPRALFLAHLGFILTERGGWAFVRRQPLGIPHMVGVRKLSQFKERPQWGKPGSFHQQPNSTRSLKALCPIRLFLSRLSFPPINALDWRCGGYVLPHLPSLKLGGGGTNLQFAVPPR